MNINEAGLKLIKHYEGCKLKPYLCPANLWTIGYGAVLYPEQAKIPETVFCSVVLLGLLYYAAIKRRLWNR
jgi:GH24 family phage-related lysozyme (muramidase)